MLDKISQIIYIVTSTMFSEALYLHQHVPTCVLLFRK